MQVRFQDIDRPPAKNHPLSLAPGGFRPAFTGRAFLLMLRELFLRFAKAARFSTFHFLSGATPPLVEKPSFTSRHRRKIRFREFLLLLPKKFLPTFSGSVAFSSFP
jgi:hypothetical protein